MKCEFCAESKLNVGDKTEYGAVVIYKIGNQGNGWFATLSPKTGGDPEKDFSIQLMPFKHIKYFSDIDSDSNPELAKNYGIAFAKICRAVGELVKDDEKSTVPVGTYAKCKHPNEHIHFKVFPYRDAIGQPYTTDSTFGRKEIYVDKDDKEFVKMTPVKKLDLSEKRFKKLSEKLIQLLK